MQNIFSKLIVATIFVAILIIIIAYARGYRIDLQKQAVTSTGILAISSSPKAATLYINGELKGVTDINLTLPPGQYQIEIKKEGYTSWTKNIKLKGELVLSLDALLFPINPSLSPLTNLGIVKAVAVDQTEKVILFSDTGDALKDGIYLFDISRKPLSFLPPLKLIILKKDLPNNELIDFKNASVDFSPDYKQAIFNLETEWKTSSYLFSLEEENKTPFDITDSKDTLIEAWQKEKEKNTIKILEIFPKEIAKIATDSFHIIAFSPDEQKMLYQPTKYINLDLIISPPMIATNQTQEERNLNPNNYYVYDKKEDKNFQVTNSMFWYTDSKHLMFIDGKKISIIDYDNGNMQAVYSGPFENSFFTTTTDGKIIILTNLNPETNKYPDLYLVGIR